MNTGLFQDMFSGRQCITPTHYQFQTTECGVAALAKILAYHGCFVPLEEIRRVTGVSRDAITAANIVAVARHFGLEAKAQRCQPEDLPRLGFPSIVHLRFIHFSVLEGMTDRHVLFNDPHGGRVDRTHETFNEDFTGVVMTFRPGPDFRKRPAKDVPLLRPAIGGIGATLVALAALLYVVAACMLVAIAGAVTEGAVGPAMAFSAALAGVTGAAGAALIAFGARLERNLTDRLTAHTLRLAPHALGYRIEGDLSGCLGSGRIIAQALARDILPRSLPLLGAPLVLAALWALDPWLGLILTAATLAYLLALALLLPWRSGRHAPAPGGDVAFYDHLARRLFTPELWKLGNGPGALFRDQMGALARKQLRQNDEVAPAAALLALRALPLPVFGGFALLFGGGDTAATTQALFLALALAVILRSVDVLYSHHSAFAMRCFLARDLVQAPTLPPDASPLQDPDHTDRMISVDDVSFGYAPHKPPLIRGVTLSVVPGEQLGITGPSGGGKSTLARLIAGLDVPSEGRITIGGRSASVERVGWVDKRAVIFEGSLRENITLWRRHHHEDAIWRALHLACLDDVVAARGGLDTPVARRGRNFSGGQVQRLEIARALLAGNRALVLDEAVDALDPRTETRMRDRLRAQGITLVVVSHRASTLAACDRVVRIAKGRLVSETAPEVAEMPVPQQRAGYQTGAASSLATDAVMGLAQIANTIAGQVVTPAPATLRSLHGTEGGYWRNVRFVVPGWWHVDHGQVLAVQQTDSAAVVHRPPSMGTAPQGPALRDEASVHYREPDRHPQRPATLLWAGFAGQHVDIGLLILVAIGAGLPLFALLSTQQGFMGFATAIVALTLATVAAAILAARIGLGAEISLNAALLHTLLRTDATTLRLLPEVVVRRAINAVQLLITAVRKASFTIVGPLGAFAAGLVALAVSGAALSGVLGLWACGTAVVAGLAALRQQGATRIAPTRDATVHLRDQMIGGQSRLRALGAFGDVAALWQRRSSALRQKQAWLDLASVSSDAVLVALPWGSAAVMAVMTSGAALPVAAWLAGWGLAEVLRAAAHLGTALSEASALGPILALPAEPRGDPVPTPLALSARGIGRIEAGKKVLADVSLTVEPARILAIAGRSGSGKSTLLRLLLGFETAETGQVSVGALPLDQIDIAQFYRRVVAIEQGATLSPASTLRSQVAGACEAGPEDIWSVLEDVGIADEVLEMPMGLQTIVEEHTISTGQMQRLLIAGALLRQPEILVLDEALSAVPDALQERLINAFRRRGITVILVTHRESAIALADRLVFLSEGRVCFDGPPAAGLANGKVAAVLAQEHLV